MKRALHLARELTLYVLFGSVTLIIVVILVGLFLMPIMFREGGR